MSKTFKLFFMGLMALLATKSMACSLTEVKAEVAKIHGPAWKNLQSRCSNTEIKGLLKKIINNPNDHLSEYDLDLRKFLFRNAVKSYGHFATGGNDVNFLSDLYSDDKKVVEKLFGRDTDLFRINILESMANTGNIEALEFYQSVLEDENSVLFLQQNAAEFAVWILEGTPLKEDQMTGSQKYGEYFFPNISEDVDARIKNDAQRDQLQERKEGLKNLVSDMLSHPTKYKQISEALNKLASALEGKNKREPQSMVVENGAGGESGNGPTFSGDVKGQPNHDVDTKREIASQEEKENEEGYNLRFYLKLFLLLCFVGLVFFFFRTKKS